MVLSTVQQIVTNALSTFLSMPLSGWIVFSLVLLLLFIWYEQIDLMRKKTWLPGPNWTLPILGSMITIVRSPTAFWHSAFVKGPLSWDSICGKFTVVVADHAISRTIFQKVSDSLPLILHPNAYTLLGKDNIAFINGPVHRALRASMLPFFAINAVNAYVPLQVESFRINLQEWVKLNNNGATPLKMQEILYDFNIYTSFRVFVGPYLTEANIKYLGDQYRLVTAAMFAFPLYLPGTKLWIGRTARNNIVETLHHFVTAAKQNMREGVKPVCLLDFWCQAVNKEIDDAVKVGEQPPPYSTDDEMAKVVLDFLFASQDASTSSLTFATHLLCEHPEIRDTIREEIRGMHMEQLKTNPTQKEFALTADNIGDFKYTWQVMKELLRFRPPATIVPHITTEPMVLNDKFTAPPGTLLVPSIWSSNRTGFTNPEEFDPERFNDSRQEHIKYEKHFLTFGTGPHSCMGQRYAMNHIMIYLALMAYEAEFDRQITPDMNEIAYAPTIYPADGCMVKRITLRDNAAMV